MHMFPQNPAATSRFYNMVGTSAAMTKIYERIKAVAPTKAPVLIVGETGTGKELVARAVHALSPRNHHPFVAVNCSAMADSLWESEMFRHERGAFTGAVTAKKGRFELAHNGTLFLDEVSEMSPALQRKSLRALQEMEFERVGGTKTIQVDVRLVAAANRDLKQGVREGWMRQDLFYRLNVIRIGVPPLREHKEDIPDLIEHFLEKYAADNRKHVAGLSHEALHALMDYGFPGNVRELQNIVHRAVILSKGETINMNDLPEELRNRPYLSANPDLSARVKHDALLAALKNATLCNNGGPPRPWHRTLRSVGIEAIHAFLAGTNTRFFSRQEFADFLSRRANSGRNKYGTAGKYLSILKNNYICVHNGKKANQSRYRLAEDFLT